MTQEQLDLLLEYIGLKTSIALKQAKGDGVSYHDYDRLQEIIKELEDLIESE